jgi:hypothetical protein
MLLTIPYMEHMFFCCQKGILRNDVMRFFNVILYPILEVIIGLP